MSANREDSWFPRCMVGILATLDHGDRVTRPAVPVFVEPKQAKVRFNGYSKADEFSLVFDAKAFPFAPQMIKRADVEIHMWAATSAGEPWQGQFNADTLMVSGRVNDKAKMRLMSDGRSYEMAGADYTSELAKKTWDPARRMFVGGRFLIDAVEMLVREVPTASHLRVVYEVPGEAGLFMGPRVTRVDNVEVKRKRTKKGKARKLPPKVLRPEGMAVKNGRSYWSLITQLCQEHGHIVFVRGDEVVITTHAGQRLTAEERSDLRVMAWGQNITELEFDRDMSADEVKQQIGRFWDTNLPGWVEVRWPPLDRQADNEYTQLPSGVKTKAAAEALLREKFEMQSRGETRIKFGTASCRDLLDRDMLRGLRGGSPVVMGFDAIGDNGDMARLTPDARYAYLRYSMGFGHEVSTRIAEAYEAMSDVQQDLYVLESEFVYDADEGIKVNSCECIGYVAPARDNVGGDGLLAPA